MRLPLEDLASLALFAQVVQARSFSEAARQAKLAKSAVSKRIAHLEERLGVRLLVRTTRKLSLTPEGLRFYEHCVELVTAANAAEESVSSASRVARGRLTVNAPVTFAQMYLAEPITTFLARHPAIEIDLCTENRVIDVIEGGFDVVLRIGRLAESSLSARRLAEDRLVLCASPSYLSRLGEPSSPDELLQHNCLHYSLVPRNAEWRFRRGASALHVPASGNFATTDGTLLREAAIAGLGIVVLPSFMVARELAAGQLQAVLTSYRRGRIGIYAMLAARRQLALRTRLFVEHLAAHFAAPRW